MDLISKLLCLKGYTTFCEMSHFSWAIFTFTAFLLVLPLCFVQNLKRFVSVNLASVFMNLFIIGIVIFMIIDAMFFGDVKAKGAGSMKVIGFGHLLKLYGVTSYSLESVALIFPIKNKLQNQHKFGGYYVFVTVCTIVVTVILSLGVYYVSLAEL